MKRPTPQLRARQDKAADRELWKRRERRYKGYYFGLQVRRQNADLPDRARTSSLVQVVTLRFSGRLNIFSAPDETIGQLIQLERVNIPNMTRTDLVIDLSRVEFIDACSLLFLASRAKAISTRPFVRVYGSFPKSPKALTTLVDADFDSYVLGRPRRPPTGRKNVSLVESGKGAKKLVSGVIANDIKSFLVSRDHRLADDIEKADHIYGAVVECIENVRHHAYGDDDKRSESKGWWAVGIYDEDTDVASVAILDMGIGIAASLGRKDPGRWGKLLGVPADLLDKASLGVWTESSDPERGKGLKSLRDFAVDAPNRRLHIVSSSGMLTCSKREPSKRKSIEKLDGTIVCIQIGKWDK